MFFAERSIRNVVADKKYHEFQSVEKAVRGFAFVVFVVFFHLYKYKGDKTNRKQKSKNVFSNRKIPRTNLFSVDNFYEFAFVVFGLGNLKTLKFLRSVMKVGRRENMQTGFFAINDTRERQRKMKVAESGNVPFISIADMLHNKFAGLKSRLVCAFRCLILRETKVCGYKNQNKKC